MRSSEVEESIFHPRKDGGGIMMILLFLESARTMARDSERGRERERERRDTFGDTFVFLLSYASSGGRSLC